VLSVKNNQFIYLKRLNNIPTFHSNSLIGIQNIVFVLSIFPFLSKTTNHQFIKLIQGAFLISKFSSFMQTSKFSHQTFIASAGCHLLSVFIVIGYKTACLLASSHSEVLDICVLNSVHILHAITINTDDISNNTAIINQLIFTTMLASTIFGNKALNDHFELSFKKYTKILVINNTHNI
jgi:hypothetical protein